MANASLTCTGRTTALGASVAITETDTSGTSRRLHVVITVSVKDGYSGARDFNASANVGGVSDGAGGSISGSKVIFDKTVTVSVGYGNTTASVACTYNASMYSQAAGGWVSISGGFSSISGLTLDNGSTSISSAIDVNFGSPCSISWTPSSKSIYNKIEFSMGKWSYTTESIHPNTTTSYTYSGYTIPNEAAAEIPNATSGTMNATLYSYSDSACTKMVGSGSSMQFTVSIPTSWKPSITSCSAIIDNSSNDVVRSWGIAIAGYTKVRIVASAEGIYGSTITRFNISGGYDNIVNNSTLDYTGRVIQTTGEKLFTITCTDSRGRTSSQAITNAINFISYTAPRIAQLTASKDKDTGFATVGTIFSFDDVGGRNTAEATLSFRIVGSQTWYPLGTIQSNDRLTTNITPTDEQSYYFKVVVTDTVGNNYEKECFLSTVKVLLDFKKDGNGLGIGKICESPGMEVSMDATFFAGVNIGTKTLEEYIQNVMRVLPTGTYGTGDPPPTSTVGQVYYKKVQKGS